MVTFIDDDDIELKEDWSTAVYGHLYAEQLDQHRRLLHPDAECYAGWRR